MGSLEEGTADQQSGGRSSRQASVGIKHHRRAEPGAKRIIRAWQEPPPSVIRLALFFGYLIEGLEQQVNRGRIRMAEAEKKE
ncbi:hypothetical protein QZM22_14425 [Burkholderia oklahomensis]|uniref:hypothetical protein n=1 Tax=Burkholderia oklahomensis TaxID=342113 RepID=UPI00264AB88F|nr:hypothetical protein [Burkholderia oklahomensis]MDN7673680.1 hypothetical protein [Burkholderia oklahomensis]